MLNQSYLNQIINIATERGLVSRYSDRTFRPNKEITYPEFVTIMVRVLGEKLTKLIGLAESTYKLIPKDILEEVEQVKEKILNGEIKIEE